MNEPQTRTARIIGWLKKPKFWLGFVIAAAITATIGSAFFLLFPCSEELSTLFSETSSVATASLVPCYDGLSTWLITIAGGFLAVAVLLQTMKRADAAGNANVQKTFSDAITHLGHESESVILGGIYSLLDLAKENKDYRLKVFKILCAYIKTTTTAEGYQKKHQKKPSTTIRTLLTLLFQGEEYSIVTVDPAKTSRTADEKYSIEKMFRFDLRGAYLAGSNLLRARLQGGDLSGAQLQHSFLPEAQLQGAFLVGTKLQEASLMLAQLQGAHLAKAHLQKAELRQTEMQGACMYQTELSHETQMSGSDLRGVSSLKPDHFIGFKSRIENRIGEETDRAGIEDKDSILATLINKGTVKVGSYNKGDADQWIKEYDGAFRWKNHQD